MMLVDKLEQYKKDGWLMSQTHPELPLTIWNYTQSTQFERKWDDITLQCRGLVTDNYGNIVARPFRKFFNIEENEHTPTSDFTLLEKMDGSLIIVFFYMDQWVVASRGSFESDQCKAATLLFNEMNHSCLDRDVTYILEYCSSWNRIVVDYGGREFLTLLGGVYTDSANLEVSREKLKIISKQLPCDLVKEYDNNTDISILKDNIGKNREGFVLQFSNGHRCKIKSDEYCRLHYIMTDVSTTSIWESLKNHDPLESFLKDIPDEFYDKIHAYIDELENSYWTISNTLNDMFRNIYKNDMSPRDFAITIENIDQPYKALLFAQFNMKMDSYSEIIWKSIRPEFRKL